MAYYKNFTNSYGSKSTTIPKKSTTRSPISIDWSDLVNNEDMLVDTIKKNQLLQQLHTALQKMDVSSIIKEDGTASGESLITLIRSKEWALEIGFPSIGILCCFNAIATRTRSDIQSGTQTKISSILTPAVPLVMNAFVDKISYGSWTFEDDDVRAMFLGYQLNQLWHLKNQFKAAALEIKALLNDPIKLDRASLYKDLCNVERPHNPYNVTEAKLKLYELSKEKMELAAAPNWNELPKFGRCMILNQHIFSDTKDTAMVRHIGDLDRKNVMFNWSESSTGDVVEKKVNTSAMLQKLVEGVPQFTAEKPKPAAPRSAVFVEDRGTW